MAAHSSTLAWRIPRTEEPVRLQSMGSQRVQHDWVTQHILQYKVIFFKCQKIKLFFKKAKTTNCSVFLLYFLSKSPFRHVISNSNEIWTSVLLTLTNWTNARDPKMQKKKKRRRRRILHNGKNKILCNGKKFFAMDFEGDDICSGPQLHHLLIMWS